MKYILLFIFNWDPKLGGMMKKNEGVGVPEDENMIVWRLTDELDLSTDQAEKFFPI